MNIKNYFNIVNNGTNGGLQNTFEKIHCENLDKKEKETILEFSNEFIGVSNVGQQLGYWCGQVISKGIREEFDLIRFSRDSVFNLELKSTIGSMGLEKIKNQ